MNEPLRVRVTKLGPGRWRAAIEGDDEAAVYEPTGDEALARLVRSHPRRFGVGEVVYADDSPAPTGESSAPVTYTHGKVIRSPDVGNAHGRVAE